MTSWASVLIRRSIACVVFVCAMIAVSGSAAANPILSANLTTTTVNVGDTLTVDIDIANAVDLFSYNFDLVFDPTFLLFSGIVQGTFFPPPPPGEDSAFFPGLPDSVLLGRVEFIADSVVGDNPGVSGAGTLAIASFKALMAGTTSITFANLLFADPDFNEIALGADPIKSGEVQVDGVATVPEEPSTMILVVAALALAACRSLTQAS
jgi:hypothetical protein